MPFTNTSNKSGVPYYGGNQVENAAPVFTGSTAPSSNFTAPGIGALYVDTATSSMYGLVSVAAGTATWAALGGASSAVSTLTGGSGGAISPSSGNITLAGTANQITTTGAGSTITWSIPSTFIAPGSIAATTTLTATLGNITATNGNLVLGTAGNKIMSTSVASTTTAGANSFGTVTLVGGTATVNTTAVTASSIIYLFRQGIGSTGAAALGILSVGTITASTSFEINAVQAADATALQASDVSVIGWMIVN